MFEFVFAGGAFFFAHGDGIQIGRGSSERQIRALAAGFVDHLFEQVMGTLGSISGQYRFEGFYPFAGFERVNIIEERVRHRFHLVSAGWTRQVAACLTQ